MKDKKFIYGSILVCVFLLTMGLTYAYFSLTVSGNDVAETINVSATKLELKYTDGKEVRSSDIEPGWTTTKTITVVNTGNEETYYTLGWQKLYNEIQKNELVIRSTCTSSGVTGGSCDNTDNVVVPQTTEVSAGSNKVIYPYKEAIAILPGETHTYTITIEFINYTDKHQNYNQSKKFYGTLGVAEANNTYSLTFNIKDSDGNPLANKEVTLHSTPMTETTDASGNVTFNDVELGDHTLTVINNNKTISTAIKLTGGTNDVDKLDDKYNVKAKNDSITLNVKLNDSDVGSFYVKGKRECTGEVTDGEFIDGQYRYLLNSEENGWSVYLNDYESTDPITTELCYTVNDKYITDMSYMFSNTLATSLDFSSFDTSNVTDMSYMFNGAKTASIDLSGLDTSNVTSMWSMFNDCAATSITGINKLDTSKVTNMSNMFMMSQATSIDLSNLNVSNVTDMNNMFVASQATSINLTGFVTSNVTNMSNMFADSKVTSLDVSSFDTSKVTNMGAMFANCQATQITGLNSFNTSNVTSMGSMFAMVPCTSLDLSSFDTSKVTSMGGMFSESKITSGYARNQEEADKFNDEAGSTIFTVKK